MASHEWRGRGRHYGNVRGHCWRFDRSEVWGRAPIALSRVRAGAYDSASQLSGAGDSANPRTITERNRALPPDSQVSSRKHAGIPTAVGRTPRASLIIADSPSTSWASFGSDASLLTRLIAALRIACDRADDAEAINRWSSRVDPECNGTPARDRCSDAALERIFSNTLAHLS